MQILKANSVIVKRLPNGPDSTFAPADYEVTINGEVADTATPPVAPIADTLTPPTQVDPTQLVGRREKYVDPKN
jgi:hypothetical protein